MSSEPVRVDGETKIQAAPQPTADSLTSLAQAEEIEKTGSPRFATAEDMFDALDI